ncbi:MAG: Internalin-A [Candidatus Anoxychlamydiales bacterium]|nr:Internalin-A [Candidatus Anoxychlamydiales bacterium]
MSLTVNNNSYLGKDGMPQELKMYIFSFLKSLLDLFSASQVSGEFFALTNDQPLWSRIMTEIGIKSIPGEPISEMKARIKKIHETARHFFEPSDSIISKSFTIENTKEALRRINEIKIRDTLTVWQKIYDQAILRGSTLPPKPTFDELRKSTDKNAIKKAFADWIDANKDKINLDSLSLSNENLYYLPKPLFELPNLRKLNLSSNKLRYIPKIRNLTLLRELNLDSNKLESFPREVCGLEKLRYLKLSNNSLNLGNNRPAAISEEEIRELESFRLETLILSNNNLTDIPEEIYHLKRLWSLNLYNNKLSSISENIRNLKNLCHLNLSNNEFASISKEIGSIKGLEGLYFSSNKLTSISEDIRKLKWLKELDLSDNKLTAIPEAMCDLEQLVVLDLHNNKLKYIPAMIGERLKKLIRLDLKSNCISYYPKSLDLLKEAKIKRDDTVFTRFYRSIFN